MNVSINLLLTMVVALIFNSNIMAQKGFDIEKEITINVTAAELWQIVGPGFVEVYKWSSNVDHAEGGGPGEFEGAFCRERFCDVNVKGFNKISERLTAYDEKAMLLTYEVTEGMPGFIVKASNSWKVIPAGPGKSKLIMNASFLSKGMMGMLTRGMMKKKMTDTLETVLNDAKIYAETGEVSDAKRKRMEKVGKKLQAAA